ncbi:ATP-grasp domain-containing protein [Natrialbaceae archaeon A-gly3]
MTADPPRVGILTSDEYADLAEDGQAIAAGLEARGIRAEPIVWSKAGDLAAYDAAVVRSCWDYHTDPEGFLSFLEDLEGADVAVYNSLEVIRWNAHKSYYRDLEAAGVPIPPSVCFEAGTETPLEAILRDHDWSDAVVKPAVGAGSAGVWKTSLEDAANDQDRFDAACADGDVVVQEFTPEIEQGERSIVFVRGEYSHAWNDPTKADDFSDFEEPDLSYEPGKGIVEDARSVLETACAILECDSTALPYARVDYVERDGEILVMELELIEPYLGLAREEGAVERFVETFTSLLRNDLEDDRATTEV